MKTTIIIIVLILSAASCRPQRSAMLQTAQQSQAQFQKRQLYQWNDNLSRRWSFYTDSPFIYHPDSALIGHSGYIGFSENRFLSSIHQLQQDSSLYESDMHKEQQKEIKGSERGLVLVSLLMILLSIVIWLYVRRFGSGV